MNDSHQDPPESFLRRKDADLPFWSEQERTIQGALGQPCCTLSGIATGLIHLPGNFAVVVHGEDECAACFRHLGPQTPNFFCTGLTEKEFVTGETATRLRACLRLVAMEVAPEAIFVLGACPVEVIGDRFETVVAQVHKEFPDIPMVALHTSGLKVGTQTAMLDWMFQALASLPVKPPMDNRWRESAQHAAVDVVIGAATRDRRALGRAVPMIRQLTDEPSLPPEDCVNLVGLPGKRPRRRAVPEVVDLLHDAGLHVVANYPHASSLADWQAIGWARNSFIADRSLYPKLVESLQERGQNVSDIPLPIGLEQSVDMYAAIGDATGRRATLDAVIAPFVAEAQEHVTRFRKRFGGMRVAYGLRMANNYEADLLAYNGLGEHRFLEELGLDVTLLVQGPPDKRDRFAKMFQRRGLEIPFEMFLEPWVIHDVLGRGKYDITILADHCRNEAEKAGVPMIPTRSLDPYLESVGFNVQYLENAINSATSRGGRA